MFLPMLLKIQSCIAFNFTAEIAEQVKSDRFAKIRPVIKLLNNAFMKPVKKVHLVAIDEYLQSDQGHAPGIQYCREKPAK